MHPVCFTLGSRPIYWYGVLMALGFLAGVATWHAVGRREGRPSALSSDLALWVMIPGIAGARIAFVISNWELYAAHPGQIIRIDLGGLVYYGGFLGAALALVVFAKRRRMPLLDVLDFVILAIPIAHAFGRIGCFLNGCCYGRPSTVPWAVWTAGADRHPTQLYEAAVNVAIYALVLWAYRTRRGRRGRVVACYLLTYPPARFLVEFLRGDERMRWLGVSVAQWLSAGLLALGVVLFLRSARRPAGHEADRLPG